MKKSVLIVAALALGFSLLGIPSAAKADGIFNQVRYCPPAGFASSSKYSWSYGTSFTFNAGDMCIKSINGIYTAQFQYDGNLVVYKYSTAIWYTHTQNLRGATLKLQSDGNLVVYNSVGKDAWNSTTQGNRPGSPNTYQLVMQNDGNLVEYYNSKPLWSSYYGRAY